MTEGGAISTVPGEDPPDWAARSIGRPGRYAETTLRGPADGAPIDEHNPGTLFIRGAAVCLAAMGRDSGTIQRLDEHDDGWYDTGDLAVPDGRGGYRLLGRVADRIGAAFMIPITDVENALRAHPDITDVAIVGYRGNTEGCAMLQSSVDLTLDDITGYLRGLDMTEWYWPTRVERTNRIPRNGMGKVDKLRLRDLLKSETPT